MFSLASLFGVMALSADIFLAVHLHLRYQELVTYKRIVLCGGINMGAQCISFGSNVVDSNQCYFHIFCQCRCCLYHSYNFA